MGTTAEIIAIGAELLLGDNTDTNSTWLSQRLVELGVTVVRHTSVGDGIDDMATALEEALGRADVVLTTGGLGPTQDDLTRVALARVAGAPLVRDEATLADIQAYFESRGRVMSPSNAQQADIPEGGRWLTRVGSAPGLALEVDGGLVVCMPGVPSEMHVMFEQDVVAMLVERGGLSTTVTRTVRTAGLSESGIADTLAELVARVERDGGPTIAFLASRGETRVKVTATAPDRPTALAAIDPVVEEVVALLGTGVMGLDDEGVEHAIGRLLGAHGWTLAVAESMTGGGVGARLVTVPGASAWFRGGLITYATEVKALLAGLDPAGLAGTGPVEGATAEALARAAAERCSADVGLGIVGVAGPEPVGDAPVGTVRVAVVVAGTTAVVEEMRMPGRSRVDIQSFGASGALSVLHAVLRTA
ncbi:CinA family nicotinamide mononucleotide deamidase-related protein [Euzebya rosea]|uniref:CinA family nicotinamide mononucleotide deamidase-related protein n=1 Tax=Euzebya rosea TaxID=2052804 RepID=UPI001300800D|nr:CinA family nicotinamide mononucleotide deamidase-related protein [Euzebya rosea]